jgi:hypothetical protein
VVIAYNGEADANAPLTMQRPDAGAAIGVGTTHDPEKWVPVFGKDHAQSRS